MPNNECIPYYEPGSRLTGKVVTNPVVGKTFVKVSTAITGGIAGFENVNVTPCVAGDMAFGVAAHDQIVGEKVPVLNGPGMVVPVTAGATLTAGQEVQSDANGRAIPLAAGKRLGMVLDDTANAADAPVRLYT